MATPNRKVLDISHWNTVTSWSSVKNAGILGIIHKSTEGTSYKDPNYVGAKNAALSQGLLWGAYHFATAEDPTMQAQEFLSVVGVDPDTLYALDWEDYGYDTMSLEKARKFLEVCDAAIGVNRTVLYSGNTAKEWLGSRADPFFGAHRLWLAQYGSTPTCQASWSTYWLWQYSDGQNGPSPHGCPGVSGDVDTNSWPSNDAALIEEWSGAEQVPPGPNPIPPIDMVNLTVTAPPGIEVWANGMLIPTVPPGCSGPAGQSRGMAPPVLGSLQRRVRRGEHQP